MAKNISNKGVRWLFSSTAFHYQAIRTIGHSIYQGALPGEVLSVIYQIRDGDTESWFDNWQRSASGFPKGVKTVNQIIPDLKSTSMGL